MSGAASHEPRATTLSLDRSAAPAPVAVRAPHALTLVLLCLLAAAATVIAVRPFQVGVFIDDAPFFFRYAESLSRGEGFRFNPGERPVWGASAPLWPLALAVLVKLGATVDFAAVALGYALTAAASALLALAARRLAGAWAALWTVVFLVTDARYTGSALMGMECPLSFALMAFGLWALAWGRGSTLLGIAAGLSLAHKIDFAVFGVLLLAALWVRTGRFPRRAALIAGTIGAAWYAFAWFHFGSPIPNSFVTKLRIATSMPRAWFLDNAILENGRVVLSVLALLSFHTLRGRRDVLLCAGGTITAFLVAYTLKPPSEPFVWYLAPVQPALSLLAGSAAGTTMHRLHAGAAPLAAPRPALLAVIIAAAGLALWREDRPVALGLATYTRDFESDRAATGRWVDQHAAPDAVVMTGYGNVAYYSHRRVIDYTYLNRRGPVQTGDEMLAEQRPDFIVHSAYASGLAPEQQFVPPGYRLAAVFDSLRRSGRADFYMFVLRREGAPLRER